MYLMLIVRLLTPGFSLAKALGYPAAWIAAAVLYLVMCAGYAGVFSKAGEAPAKAFVPILNVWTAFRLSGGGPLLFAAYCAVLAIGCVWSAAIDLSAFAALPQSGASLAMALSVFFYAYQCFRLSASFGRDLPAAVALLLAEPIAVFTYGFGPARYFGPARAANPFSPFDVKNLFGEDSIFDDEMNLKDEYKDLRGK